MNNPDLIEILAKAQQEEPATRVEFFACVVTIGLTFALVWLAAYSIYPGWTQ